MVSAQGGGMAGMNAAYVAGLSEQFEFIVLANEVDERSAQVAQVMKVPTLNSPAVLRFIIFWVIASWKLARLRRSVDLVWTCGAIVAGRVDLMSVHLCQAGLVERYGGAFTPPGLKGPARFASALHRRVALKAERRSVAKTRLLAAVSTSLQSELAGHYPQSKWVITPNGAELDRFAECELPRSDDAELKMLFIGGDWWLRKLATGVEALALARSQGAQISLRIVGDGDEAWLRGFAAEQGVEDSLIIEGYCDNVTPAIAKSDLLLVTSPYETFSLVALEAAAAGRPIVGTAVGILPDLILGDGDDARAAGGIITDGSAAELAAAMLALARDRQSLRSLGEVARRRAGAFTMEAAVEKLGLSLEGLL
ncbi:MAG: glycosyltransferase [Actinobacteria bacterium]|nr:glycosyltransferase [Actinomycetota bacterium]